MALRMNKYGGLILPPGVNDLPPGAQRRLLEDMVRRLREQETHEEEPAEAQPAPPPEPEPPEPSLPPRSARKASGSAESRSLGARVLNFLIAVVIFTGILGGFFAVLYAYSAIETARRDRFFAESERRAHAAVASASSSQIPQPAPSPPPQLQQPKPVALWIPWTTLDLAAGETRQLQAWAQYEGDGAWRDVTAGASYASSNPAVATVTSGGLITAVSPGQTVITVVLSSRPELCQRVVVSVRSSQASQPAAVDWNEVAKRVAPYVFRVESSDGGSIGTAFYTGDQWLAKKEYEAAGKSEVGTFHVIYTAAHIVQGHEKCLFEFQRVWKGKVEKEWAWGPGAAGLDARVDISPDFIALYTSMSGQGFLDKSPEEYFLNAPLFGNAYALTPGETVLIVGNPRNLWQWDPRNPGPLATMGKVLAVDASMRMDDGTLLGTLQKHVLKIEADTDPGSSGSPVFNSRGEVVGMVIAESTERVPNSDLNRHVIWAIMFPLRK